MGPPAPDAAPADASNNIMGTVVVVALLVVVLVVWVVVVVVWVVWVVVVWVVLPARMARSKSVRVVVASATIPD